MGAPDFRSRVLGIAAQIEREFGNADEIKVMGRDVVARKGERQTFHTFSDKKVALEAWRILCDELGRCTNRTTEEGARRLAPAQ